MRDMLNLPPPQDHSQLAAIDYTKPHVKQLLIVRKDLRMRQGKTAAQCAHAAMMFLVNEICEDGTLDLGAEDDNNTVHVYKGWLTEEQHIWTSECFRKVTVYVNSLDELNAVCDKAREAGLTVNVMEDSGETEFHGVPTITVAAIGPHYSEKFIGITDHLPLL